MEKHILLCMTLRHLFRSKEFMTLLNRMGHCESYLYSIELETSLANAVMQSGSLLNSNIVKNPDPSIHIPGSLIHTWWDNFDKNVASGSIHTAHGLFAQELGEGQNLPSSSSQEVEQQVRSKKRSLDLSTQPSLPLYYSKGRVGPAEMNSDPMESNNDVYTQTMHINLVWMLAREMGKKDQGVPGLSGFISVTGYVPQNLTTLGYFPMINAPITDLVTIQECLRRSEEATNEVGQAYIITTFDLGVCMKAYPMVWGAPERYRKHVILMGTFHTCCAYLKAIGKKMSGSGLEDILLESGIATTGSINSVMAGKNYECGLVCHKAVVEYLERSMYQKFLKEDNAVSVEVMSAITKLQEWPSGQTLANAMANDDVSSHIDAYLDFRHHLSKGEHGCTAQLWVTYANNVWLVLQLIAAVKRNDYDTYLICTKAMPDIFFAFDMQNYAPFLTFESEFLSNLDNTHPGAEQLLRNGAIGAARSYTPGNRTQFDKTGEETIMRHSKASSGPGTAAAGLTGITGNPEAYQRHIITTHERVSYAEAAYRMADMQHDEEKNGKHKDLRPSQVKRSEDLVTAVGAAFDGFANPFNIQDDRLICLSSGAPAGEEITTSLLNAEKKGKEQKEMFIQKRLLAKHVPFFDPIKRNNFKTMATKAASKKVTSSASKVVQYKATSSLVFQLFVKSQMLGVEISTAELMTYPLTVTPCAIATTDGFFAKTNKAAGMNKMISEEDDVDLPPVETTAVISDGNATFYMKQVPARMGQIAQKILQSVPSGAETIFSIDSYHDDSIKTAERQRRGCGEKFVIQGEQTKRPHDWKGFLSNDENKQQLIHILSKSWSSDANASRLQNQPVILIENGIATQLSSVDGKTTTAIRIPELDSTQEETDTRIMLYIQYAQDTGRSYARVRANDSDIFFILLHYAKQLTITVILDTGTRLINISDITEEFTQEWCTALLGLHAYTGCDSTSAFKGRGKIKPLKALQGAPKFVPVLAKLGDEWEVSDESLDGLEEFCCLLYGHKRVKRVNTVRDVKLKKVCGSSGTLKSTTSVDL